MRDFILYSHNISKYSDDFVILHKCRKHDAFFNVFGDQGEYLDL